MKLLKLFLLGLILISFFVSPILGDDDDDDDYDDEREVEFSRDGDHKVELESKSRKDGVKTKLEFSIEVDDGEFEFELEYKKEEDKAEVEAEYKLEIKRLIEYNETNNIPGYQPGEEVVVYDLGDEDLDWNRIECTPLDNQINCTISTVGGYFTAIVRIAGTIIPIPGEMLRPSSAKADIVVQKTAGTYFAIEMKLESEEEQEYRDKSSEQSSGISQKDQREISFAGLGFFSWDASASIGDTTVDIIHSITKDSKEDDGDEKEHKRKITYSFPTDKGGELVWDPKLGLKARSSSATFTPSVLLFLVAVFSTVMLM